MKNLIYSAFLIAFFSGCTHQVELSEEMPGAYFLTSQVVKSGMEETRYTDLKQLKIYTGTHFMYTQINPGDSTSAFGVGSYTTGGDTLTEHVVYSSGDTTFRDQPVSYDLLIKITPEGFNQIIKGIEIRDTSVKLIEEYEQVGSEVTTPLDGVWKEERSFLVSGNDTTYYDRTQYKAFFGGYFMFGNTVVDSMGNTNTGMGFGTFEMNGEDQIKETDINSSYPIIAGNTFTIDLEMIDNDHFKQTIENSDGSRSVEYYVRLK